jgi:tetratricopeptide (TPR) repeat protein
MAQMTRIVQKGTAPRFRLCLVVVLLALVTLAAYLPVFHNGFLQYDDSVHVRNNRVVQNGITRGGITWAFTTCRGGFWHPLTWLSHMLDCELFGLNSGAQHYVNVLFHTANTILLLLLLYRLTADLWPSAYVAALFAWHPLHVESVAWLSERKDVLSTFFGMLALLAYTRYAQSRCLKPQPQAPRGVAAPPGQPFGANRGALYFWLALICFVTGLMAKPMLVTMPFVMLLLDFWPLRRIPQLSLSSFPTGMRLVFEKWPFLLFSGIASVVAVFAERNGGMTVSLEQVPLPLRLANVLVSYTRYLGKTVWPANLSVLYPLPPRLPWSEVIAAAICLTAITWSAWRMRGRYPYLLVGWLWFLGTLVPVIGLVQLNVQSPGDHYTYIPLIGIFVAIAFGMKDLIGYLRIKTISIAVLASMVLGACLTVTEHQLSYWRNDETLFSHAVAVTEDNAGTRLNLGLALAANGRLPEAQEQFQEATRISPDNAAAHIFLAKSFTDMGNTSEALAECQTARNVLNLNSEQPQLHYNLGSLLVQLGRLDEAMEQYNQAAQFASDNPDLYYEMGKLLLMQGHDDDAVARLRESLRLDPFNVPALGLLAQVLASDDQPQIRNGAEALGLAERADTLTRGRQPYVLDTLAMAYAEIGRFSEAQQAEQRAIQLAGDAGLPTDDMSRRLTLYQSGQPFRVNYGLTAH